MFSRVLCVQIVVLAFFSGVFALSGTGGTPLGGMGTGYVVFNGQKFGVSGKMPPAGADKGETQISSSGFHFFVDGTAKSRAQAVSEDAKCPLQTADFGTVGDVEFRLNGFGPYLPGEDLENYQLATSPLALFDITAVNGGAATAAVAVAMEFANEGLLGGANSGTVETGNRAILFSGSPANAYLTVDCDNTTPEFSAGAEGTFSSDGKLANTDGNLVAAKCNIAAGETVHFKFVLAWYRTYGSENYYYHNFYSNSKEAAEFGLSKFDEVRDGITSFVDRVMASNFPEWYKDRLLNNTYPLIHNSQCAKDGRVAFWEGNYGIIGTIDQGQHAALFYTFNWPKVQWQELQFWKRSAKSNGQIHHDVNEGKQSFTPGSDANNRYMLAWDNSNHADYWWFPNCDSWSDLNSMFIFKAYELMLATGDHDSMTLYFPAIKKTAERILSQCGSGSKLPLNCHSTYDICQGAGGSNCTMTPEYNAGLAVTTYLAVSEIAKFCGEDATATTFREHYEAAKAEYKQKYGNSISSNSYASVSSRDYAEGDVAGYSWANYLCLEPIMDEEFITSACEKLRSGYDSQSGIRNKLGRWVFYTVDHWGGSEIAINNPDRSLATHKLDYQYYYEQVPNMVFWQTLQKGDGNTHKDSYMTAPTVWRSYFQFCGYMIDNAFQRLWIRPRIPSEMNGKITNALLLNPKALGTLNYDETADEATGRTQTISIKYDKPVTIREIVLKNNTGVEEPYVVVSGAPAPVISVEGSGHEKNIRVALAAPIQIGPEGVGIEVYDRPVSVENRLRLSSLKPLALNTFRLTAGAPVRFSVDAAGEVTMDLMTINGAKIGTIMKKSVSAGSHKFVWNGKTTDGRHVGSVFAVLRLTSPAGSITRIVTTVR